MTAPGTLTTGAAGVAVAGAGAGAGAAGRARLLRDATEVADWRLCIGCGACVPACGAGLLTMVDRLDDGLRPQRAQPRGEACAGCSDCLQVCPGLGAPPPADAPPNGAIPALAAGWGPVLEVWEGHASDAALRHAGSSGGLANAFALHALEEAGMHGVLQVASDPQAPQRNRTQLSRNRDDLLAAAGSRYAPASPCDALDRIENAPGPCVFIGKPCDVQALRKSQARRPALAARVGLAIGIFCAGTPSSGGTLALLARHRIALAPLRGLRYRGQGWPGRFAVQLQGEPEWHAPASYAEAWGFLESHRPHRCHLCPDGSSEFADLACGDPWHLDPAAHPEGMSLLLVRTEAGRAFVRSALAAGRVVLEPVGPAALEDSQRELRRKRGAIWGRLLALRALGVPAPVYPGFPLWRNWRELPWRDKLRALLGTARRAWQRGYRRPMRAGPGA